MGGDFEGIWGEGGAPDSGGRCEGQEGVVPPSESPLQRAHRVSRQKSYMKREFKLKPFWQWKLLQSMFFDVTLRNSCSKLHYQKGLNSFLLSYEIRWGAAGERCAVRKFM